MSIIEKTKSEITFSKDEFIISKTDLKGKITYCNELFIEVSQYNEDELLGAPHSLLRHPDMPSVIFAHLWSELQLGHEVFAYVKNRNKLGKFYWVLAFVTPSFNEKGELFEYFSVRRVPASQDIIETIDSLYSKLLLEEKRAGLSASQALLNKILEDKGVSYEEFIFSF
ncbi:MAG: PAS domain-containing protein [Campylobacterota bacterium]|nr:PAS domain-containing protein [Campylobacterota bacterium]